MFIFDMCFDIRKTPNSKKITEQEPGQALRVNEQSGGVVICKLQSHAMAAHHNRWIHSTS